MKKIWFSKNRFILYYDEFNFDYFSYEICHRNIGPSNIFYNQTLEDEIMFPKQKFIWNNHGGYHRKDGPARIKMFKNNTITKEWYYKDDLMIEQEYWNQ